MHVHFPIETQVFFAYTKLFFPSTTGSNTLLYKQSKALSCGKRFIIHFNPTASQGSRNNTDVTLQQCHHAVMSPCSDLLMQLGESKGQKAMWALVFTSFNASRILRLLTEPRG